MKKRLKIALVTAVGITGALLSAKPSFAVSATATSTLNVVLADVVSITVNPSNSTVNLNFATSADYQNGVNSGVLADHLTIASTQSFTVTVKSDGDLVNGAENIPIGDIGITASAGTGSPVGTPGAVAALSSTDQSLITSTNPTLESKYSMQYAATGGTDFIGLTAGTYTATITYTVTAP
jgi:hypothetical protein